MGPVLGQTIRQSGVKACRHNWRCAGRSCDHDGAAMSPVHPQCVLSVSRRQLSWLPRPCVRLGFRPKPAGARPTVSIRPTRRLQGTCHHSFCSPVFSKLSRLDVHLSLGTGISRPTGKASPPLLTHVPPGKKAKTCKGTSKEILQDS